MCNVANFQQSSTARGIATMFGPLSSSLLGAGADGVAV